MAFSLDIYMNWGYPLSVVLSVTLGFLWYGPLFHDIWLDYSNFSQRSLKRWANCQYSNKAMVQSVCSFIGMATAIQYLVHTIGYNTAMSGCYLGAALFAGFALPLLMVHHLNDPRGKKVVLLIDLTFQLACFVMQSAVIAHFNA